MRVGPKNHSWTAVVLSSVRKANDYRLSQTPGLAKSFGDHQVYQIPGLLVDVDGDGGREKHEGTEAPPSSVIDYHTTRTVGGVRG